MGCLKSRKAKGKQSEMGAAGVSAKQKQSPRSAALISGEQTAQALRNGSRKGAMPTSQSTAPQDTILWIQSMIEQKANGKSMRI